MGTVNGCIFFIFQLRATYSDTGQILKNVIFSHDRASVIQLCTLHYTLIFSPMKLKPSEMIKLICKCFQSKDLLLALIFYVFLCVFWFDQKCQNNHLFSNYVLIGIFNVMHYFLIKLLTLSFYILSNFEIKM